MGGKQAIREYGKLFLPLWHIYDKVSQNNKKRKNHHIILFKGHSDTHPTNSTLQAVVNLLRDDNAVAEHTEIFPQPSALGRRHRPHRAACRRRARAQQRHPLCPLLQEMASGHGGIALRRGCGEPRDTGAHRSPGHLQDFLAQQPAGTRAAPLLLPEEQRATAKSTAVVR